MLIIILMLSRTRGPTCGPARISQDQHALGLGPLPRWANKKRASHRARRRSDGALAHPVTPRAKYRCQALGVPRYVAVSLVQVFDASRLARRSSTFFDAGRTWKASQGALVIRPACQVRCREISERGE